MVNQVTSISRRHGGARVGAGRPRLRERVSETPSIGLSDLGNGTSSVAVVDGEKTWYAGAVRSRCNFGGYRTWLCCPSCSRRVCSLYLGANALACQHCLMLQHDSQSEGPLVRSRRRTRKLKEKLPFFDKPKWMRWSTYRRLRCALMVEHNFRFEVLGQITSGESEVAASQRVQIALDASRAPTLTDKELCRALGRIFALRARPKRSPGQRRT